MKKNVITVSLVSAVLALTLAGCGSSAGSGSSASASGSASAASAASASASAAASESASSAAATGETVSFVDDLGNEVTVPFQPQRVVACMGSFADVWQLAGGTLVGAAEESFADYGIDPETVKSIGGFSTPDLEAIIALEPDFVIMTGATAGRGGTDQTAFADALAESGIPVAYFTVTTFDDYLRMLKVCTEITGNEEAYEQYGASQQAAIDAAVEKYAPGAEGKTVALMISYSSGVRVQNASTQTGDMLADLGYANITDANPSILQDFSVEALLEIDPDYILVIPMGNNEEEAANALSALTDSDAWNSLTAVSEGNFHTLDYDMYVSKPNARWAEAYENLGAQLQG